MGIIDGGTIRDFARIEIDMCFAFEPIGTKKTIEQIFEERTPSTNLRKMMQGEANRMVSQRFLFYDKNKRVYVFSKNSEGKYSWQPATFKDRILNYFFTYFSGS